MNLKVHKENNDWVAIDSETGQIVTILSENEIDSKGGEL